MYNFFLCCALQLLVCNEITYINLVHLGVKPTLPELEKFEEAPEGMMIDVSGADKEDLTHNFSTGDNVEVTEGELVNLQGTILAVDGPKITIKPNHKDLIDNLEFQASELRKYFKYDR